MYEYVRRQQELQPGAFVTKTFHWMDDGPREPSWTRMHSRNMPADPLAYSSSSLFAGPQPLKHGTLSVLQRSAASLTQHRALLALRRHRQSSEIVVRPPSGVSGAFWPRRRGFTAPPGAQAPLVRALMHWSRNVRPGAPQNQQQHQRQRHNRSGPPITMASVLCAANKTRTAGASTAGPADGPLAAAPRKAGALVLPAGPRPRMLPRSPLANSVVFTASEDHSVDDGTPEPGARGVLAEADSSDEEGRVCAVCVRFKNAEWMVQCGLGHPLCFGCVQQHVKLLLAATAACTVVCPSGSCAAAIAARDLRVCLPPHRLQQLMANRRRNARPQGILRRSLSMCARWMGADTAAGPGSPNSSDDGFDAPLAAAAAAPIEPRRAEVPLGGSAGSQAAAEAARRRFSASMPMLPPAAPTGTSGSDPLLSELTSVGPGSVDSVVVAASVAADSTRTLSPESVGSRLRRVPKARGNLAPRTWVVESSSSCRRRSRDPPGIGPRVQSMHGSAAGNSPVRRAPPPRVPPPPPPPPLPAAFRASATWITPSQRNSGYAEDLLLNATLFETIRTPLSDDEDDDSSSCDHVYSSDVTAHPADEAPAEADSDSVGVYIPTWRKPQTARPQTRPLWTDVDEHESQTAFLCEAAGLTFDLYETLHRRR
ncbi:hypothetical protein LPJ61_000210 [Coemansia biformis]|uniref:Uncharacterized protein n=1 Tax=Coemansia biformis TaxID=1286918 RepID=A0A9W7YGP4_9FUNG|nr:hypothetical protein LPJ61_000210 [Coemansia biformis]